MSVSVSVERVRERGTASAWTGSWIACRPFTEHSTHLFRRRLKRGKSLQGVCNTYMHIHVHVHVESGSSLSWTLLGHKAFVRYIVAYPKLRGLR